MTRGYRAVKIAAETATVPSALSANAQPSRPNRTSTPDRTKASAQAAASAIGTMPPTRPGPGGPPDASQAAVPATRAAASGDTSVEVARARSASGPDVLSDRNVAPWATNRARLASPPTTATGVNSAQKFPRNSPAPDSRTPCTRSVKTTPQAKAGTRLPTASAASQVARQRRLSRWPRNSKLITGDQAIS